MKITVRELSEIINGEINGDPGEELDHFAPIEEAGKGALTFLANPKYTKFVYETSASAILVSENFMPERSGHPTLIKVKDVYKTLSGLLEKFNNLEEKKTGIEKNSYIDPSASIGKGVYIGAFAYIGKNAVIADGAQIYPHVYVGDNSTVGKNSTLHSGVKVYRNCQIGNNCIIHAGSVIGSDGFGFAPLPDGQFKKIPQTGNVIIEDDVEIGANTVVDRATIKSTFIKKGAKLDNLIQVAHNVEIGENTAIAAQAGISGSTKVGKNSLIGGQVGIVGHISIAPRTQIGAQSGVSNSIKESGQKFFGSPAQPVKDAFRSATIFKNLPDLYKRLKEVENFVKDLNKKRTSE